ncbi:MAG: MarR family transcriptional regulator, partial [Candidatus Moranbacteria bacterium]|nr:MarR family transcriptional regulator [Candidatus Moranbacteria bacterium]
MVKFVKQFRKEVPMGNIEQYGLYRGKGKHYEEIIYASALIYGLVHQRISDYLKEYDLTVGKLNILIAVKHHGGEQGLSQVELSKHLIVTPSNMTKMIDKLEKDGFLTRSA